ncbi:MAG: hypothetical protein AB7D57_13760, partial [Desulfovibrionaceae bacterium]
VADHRIHEPDLSLLDFILGRIQFNNFAALRTDDLRQAVSGDRAALAAALNRLAAANYLIYRRAEDNIILQINPNLAWKGDISGSQWQTESEAFNARAAAARPTKDTRR